MDKEDEKKFENQIEEGEFENPTAGNESIFQEVECFQKEKKYYSCSEFEELKLNESSQKISEYKKLNMSSYQKVNQVGEGTFGKVYKAKLKNFTKKTFHAKGEFVALKKILVENEREGFPITAIREIMILKKLNHPNIVSLYDIVTSKANCKNGFKGNVYLVFEYMEHDLSGLLAKKYDFSVPMIKCIVRQIFKGIEFMHSNNIMHRDLKPANILVNNQGEVKIGDFGLARYFSPINLSGIYSKKYTNGVVTLWYRAPELLLGSSHYGPSLDVWSLGCMLAELVLGYPLFREKKEKDQLEKIFEICGTPTEEEYPEMKSMPFYHQLAPRVEYQNKLNEIFENNSKADEVIMDLINKLLQINPTKRISIKDALNHQFFRNHFPPECSSLDLPKSDKDNHEYEIRNNRKPNQFLENNINKNTTDRGKIASQDNNINNQKNIKNNSNIVNNFINESEKKFADMQKNLILNEENIYKSKLHELIKKTDNSENFLNNKRLNKDK